MDKSRRGCINRSVREQPSIVSERMVLRPVMEKDAPAVQRLASSRKVADTAKTVKVKAFPSVFRKGGPAVDCRAPFFRRQVSGPQSSISDHQPQGPLVRRATAQGASPTLSSRPLAPPNQLLAPAGAPALHPSTLSPPSARAVPGTSAISGIINSTSSLNLLISSTTSSWLPFTNTAVRLICVQCSARRLRS
jgi:hypothetical protein